jgi:hypothetical protein
VPYLAYLEPDDELTSAAARIRNAPGSRVGLVLPFNSRVATSRINFRLLAREADDAGKTLDIIAPDAAARALAASAGLLAFATVGEYEAGVDGAASGSGRWTDDLAPGMSGVPLRPETADQWSWEPVSTPERSRTPYSWDAQGGAQSGGLSGGQTGGPKEPTVVRGSRPMVSPTTMGGILVVAVLLGMAGAAAAMLLPAAEITVTAKTESVPPLTFTVTADPAVTEPDATAMRIPAHLVQLPVSVSGEYAATGKKITETKASGAVQFESINTVFAVSVPKGTRVSTLDGVLFTTTATVVVPRATVSGSTIKRGTVSTGITAVKAGLASNVAAGTITQVPGTLATQQIAVSNPGAASGGTHTETAQIAQADVDAALKDLETRLDEAFAAAVAAPPGLPAGSLAYPETAVMDKAVPDTDPTTLAGTKTGTFSLSLSATGSMLAVDAAPITAIGEAIVSQSVLTGYRLVPGSISVQVGTGVTADGTVTFDVRASAKRVRQLDAAALLRDVLGHTEADARAALEAYGAVTISFWPGWVESVPTNASRVMLSVSDGLGGREPGATQSPVPSGP